MAEAEVEGLVVNVPDCDVEPEAVEDVEPEAVKAGDPASAGASDKRTLALAVTVTDGEIVVDAVAALVTELW